MVTRHRSQKEWFPVGYEAQVTGQVVSKCVHMKFTSFLATADSEVRATGYRSSCSQEATRQSLQDEWFPKYQARFTGSSPIPHLPLLSFVHSLGSGCRQENASHKMMSPSGYETTGYEAPVT